MVKRYISSLYYFRGNKAEKFLVVTCGYGTYLESDDGQCHFCPVDYYQDVGGQTACKPCPAGQHTLGEGAKRATRCQGERLTDVETVFPGGFVKHNSLGSLR